MIGYLGDAGDLEYLARTRAAVRACHSAVGRTRYASLAHAAGSCACAGASAGVRSRLRARIGSGGTHGRTSTRLAGNLDFLANMRAQLVEIASERINRAVSCSERVIRACRRTAKAAGNRVAASAACGRVHTGLSVG